MSTTSTSPVATAAPAKARRQSRPADPNEPVISPVPVVIDNNEQLPYLFAGFRTDEPASSKKPSRPLVISTISRSLHTGDYSLDGFENSISIERKSLADAYGTFGRGRERFEKELYRLNCMESGNVVIESEWSTIMSRVCHGCLGAGFTLDPTTEVSIKFTSDFMRAVGAKTIAEVLREVAAAGRIPKRIDCQTCQGTGKLHPVENSHLSPRSVVGSIVAWRHEFPNVHFWTMPGRMAAERLTWRILRRFWEKKEREAVVARAAAESATK
ncbi:MAG: hypothetical protein NT069_29295 [Planctomycetota bacterium]|nr:hypothetical protein [Planctomycetota bacterium]